MPILGSLRRDLGFLVLPGLLGITVGRFFSDEAFWATAYLFFVTAVVDSGHVYTTLLRTYLNPGERRHWIYWIVPPLVALFFTCWFFFRIPGVWSFVVYATAFHHIRQFYGVTRWCQKANGRLCLPTGRYLYALTVIPLVLYHFRPGAKGQFYSDNDLFLYPQLTLFQGGVLLYGVVVLSWLIFEWGLYRRSKRWEMTRFLSVAGPAALYALAFFFGENAVQILLPLMLAHGIGYFGMMALSLNRTLPRRYPTWPLALGAVCMVALVLGAFAGWVEKDAVDFETNYFLRQWEWRESLIQGLYLVPLFTHFILDAFIWRGKHREAKAIFATPVSPQSAIRMAA